MNIEHRVQQIVTAWAESDTEPVDETLSNLDPTDEAPKPQTLKTVRYSTRFEEQVRNLGGVDAEAALIVHTTATAGDNEADASC